MCCMAHVYISVIISVYKNIHGDSCDRRSTKSQPESLFSYTLYCRTPYTSLIWRTFLFCVFFFIGCISYIVYIWRLQAEISIHLQPQWHNTLTRSHLTPAPHRVAYNKDKEENKTLAVCKKHYDHHENGNKKAQPGINSKWNMGLNLKSLNWESSFYFPAYLFLLL